jgi:hypothetical protein
VSENLKMQKFQGCHLAGKNRFMAASRIFCYGSIKRQTADFAAISLVIFHKRYKLGKYKYTKIIINMN